jgi:hypothetical protein
MGLTSERAFRRSNVMARPHGEGNGTPGAGIPEAHTDTSGAASPSRRRRRALWLSLLAALLCLALIGGIAIYPRLAERTMPPKPQPFYSLKGGGHCVTLGDHPQPPAANIQVSRDTFADHSEPMLAEDPRNPLHLVGGSKFFTDPAHYRFKIGSYASFDGGCTWADGGLLPGYEPQSQTSDISFAFGPTGAVYAAVLTTGPGRASGISVSASADGGKTFAAPVAAFTDPAGRIFSDKPWIAVDSSHGPHRGAIYVVWSYDYDGDCGDDANACRQELAFSRSIDGGKTFSPVQFIEGAAPFCTNPAAGRPATSRLCDAALGATPVVEPDGTLAVAYAYIDLNSGPIPTRMLVVASRDGGQTWTGPVLVASVRDISGPFPPNQYRNFSLPAFACDPTTGQLYLAWSAKTDTDADVFLSTSNASDQAWSAPVRVNDDPAGSTAYQFQPQLAVAPDGVVSVSFFDTRLDPQRRLIDVYLAQSVDRGATILPNQRITTRGWDPAIAAPLDDSGAQFIGDYQGLAADDHFVHPFWNDTRTGIQDIFTAAVPSAHPATPNR